MNRVFDVIVIGGGFYGCLLAEYYAKKGASVALLERHGELLQEASFVNQARVHNGYHYPRSALTAFRSRENLPRFIEDFPDAVERDFDKLYAIARQGSHVNARQFELFCRNIGAACETIDDDAILRLFDEDRIEAVFRVQEYAFNADILRRYCLQRLEDAGVQVCVNTRVERVVQDGDEGIRVQCDEDTFFAETVLNVTYAGLNAILQASELPLLPLRYEWTEMVLVQMPEELERVGVTVMDGPFFSAMPFPARGLHSLSHVRYTPHHTWTDSAGEPGEKPEISNARPMIADVMRYMPAIRDAQIRESIHTIKTVLQLNDRDDGRPILLRRHHGMKNFHVVMGGKIDNIYDIIEALDKEW